MGLVDPLLLLRTILSWTENLQFWRGGVCVCILLFVAACSGLERAEEERIRRRNCVAERIYRNHNEYFSPVTTPLHTPREPYPWEVQSALPKITKEFFRCKGSPLHSPYPDLAEQTLFYHDCGGSSTHGLPIIGGKEGIYPVLLELLNYIQKMTHRKVIVTSGHSCPIHNTYNDASKENRTSKHQIGAEVDFYVEGMEEKALEIVELLLSYYREHPAYQGHKEWTEFQRYDKADARVTTQPWLNKEIYMKVSLPEEGRDRDNQHPYAYISLQVRYDRERQERVVYSWEKANRGYPRY